MSKKTKKFYRVTHKAPNSVDINEVVEAENRQEVRKTYPKCKIERVTQVCPYQSEIHQNHNPYCNCFDEVRLECGKNI